MLIHAIEQRNTVYLYDCLNKGVDPNKPYKVVDYNGLKRKTLPLIYACKSGFREGAIALVKASSHNALNHGDQDGSNALMYASRFSLDVVKEITNILPFKDYQDYKGMTPIMVAAYFNQVSIIEYFIKIGHNINAIDKNGKNALFYAIEKGNVEAIRCMLQHKIYVNILDSRGLTPLMSLIYASYVWLIELTDAKLILKLLLDNQADPYFKLKKGRNLFEMVLLKNDENMLLAFTDATHIDIKKRHIKFAKKNRCFLNLKIIRTILEKKYLISVLDANKKEIQDNYSIGL